MKKREVGVSELNELIALFDACDSIGRHVILETARRQAATAAGLAPSLTLVLTRPGLDKRAHDLDRVINHATLTLVSDAVHAKKT